jgi:hypothetical protein
MSSGLGNRTEGHCTRRGIRSLICAVKNRMTFLSACVSLAFTEKPLPLAPSGESEEEGKGAKEVQLIEY